MWAVIDLSNALQNIQVLCLRSNRISCTKGLEKLIFLEKLDLRDNLIVSFHEIERLASLLNLGSIILIKNPISENSNYRPKILSILSREKLSLDGKMPTSSEISLIKGVTLERQSDPSLKEIFVKPFMKNV